MTVVLDSSAAVALLVDTEENVGPWVETTVAGSVILGPHLMPAEVGNILRRRQAAGALDAGTATAAHQALRRLPVRLVGYERFAERIWALRENLTVYDAWYVALAESLGAPLVTLDRRLARAPGPRCEFRTPGAA